MAMFKKIVKNFGPEWQTAVMGTEAVCVTLSIAIGMLFTNSAKAEDSPYSFSKGGFQLYQSEDESEKLTLGGSVLYRYAYWNWFETNKGNNDYNFSFQRTRLNLKYTSEDMEIFFQPQYVHMFGLPDDAVATGKGPFGMGGLYYLHNPEENPYDFGVHQAYFRLSNLFDTKLFFKGGRFEYSDGLEVQDKKDGKKFNILKNMRLADRMISPFGWSAFGRSFDGVVAGWDFDYFIFLSHSGRMGERY